MADPNYDIELTEFRTMILGEDGNDYFVSVFKNGGGTVGEDYAGELWSVLVADITGATVLETTNLYCGMPQTHEGVATIAVDFVI